MRPPMPDTHTAFAQEVDRYAAERVAATAAAKAKRLWPDVIGEVLADEIMALLELPLWLRSQSRTQQLVERRTSKHWTTIRGSNPFTSTIADQHKRWPGTVASFGVRAGDCISGEVGAFKSTLCGLRGPGRDSPTSAGESTPQTQWATLTRFRDLVDLACSEASSPTRRATRFRPAADRHAACGRYASRTG
jgi:hypothetical protein